MHADRVVQLVPVARRDSSRSGLTLFEILLVLGLLVALGAIAWPAVESSFENARLRNAGDRVRTAWSQARLEAMRTGTVHEFRFELGGSTFQVRAWGAQAPVETTTTETVPPQGDLEVAVSDNALPAGVTFATVPELADQRAGLVAAVVGENIEATGNYSPPIVFYADGTTSDAAVYLKNERNLYLRIALRGLTGISRASDLLTVDELNERR